MSVLAPIVIANDVEQDYRRARGYSFVDWLQLSLERQFAIRSQLRRLNHGVEITGTAVPQATRRIRGTIHNDARRQPSERIWNEVRELLLSVLRPRGDNGAVLLRRMTSHEEQRPPIGSPLKAGYLYNPNAILVASNLGRFRMVSTGTEYSGIPPERAVSPALLIAHELTHLLPTRLYNETQAIGLINGARQALNLPIRNTHGSVFYYPNANAPNPGIYQWRPG